ncbi:aldehyde dehydrogenase (NAD+) [Sphingobium sp. B1D7B]|uniref:aldehyde dehydrogenase family protein n=1 Tax=unclassified Sphingobium TaxID=2611147 RepID=UPI0022258169|nr:MULTISPECIES: aldehyde dehydrogenase family protein [unclassified Sphingobium]MCW2392675.1 aldehyde dehydrogenase (NAD+) [Sphingobium sp. B11D3A]MCW2404370.1 aldehyde dehydrogenase (NAD+) [Sphingobium sp. B1D7B]
MAPRIEKLLIDGQWTEASGGETFETINPADGSLLAHIARATAQDVDRAVAAARAAFEQGPWSRFSPVDRQALLMRLADLLERDAEHFARLDTLEMGSPIRHTRGSVAMLVDLLRYFAGIARSIEGTTNAPSDPGLFACTVKEPVGVCGAIIPWNGPLWASVLKLGPVLASGCTLVLKPAEDASLAPLRLAELALEAGVPDGVFNVVTGFGTEAGAALATHPGVDKIAFTGSVETGQQIIRASAGNLKRLSLELGGKSPNIVFADANLEAAARAAVGAAFANSGQVCSAGTRLFVERPVHRAFAAEVARIAADLKIGNGLDPQTDLGPLVSARQLSRVSTHMEDALAEGAQALSGGARLSGADYDQGFFFPPTVLVDAHDEMRAVREEIFGPILATLPFDSEDEVIARANATQFGLGAGVWTSSVGRAHRLSRALKAGSVWVNCYNRIDPAVPSGGVKASGQGREYGRQHVEEHFQLKSVWIDTAV